MTWQDISSAPKDDAKPMFAEPIADWHAWFAWFPVRTWDGRWSWLISVERRLCQNHYYLDHGQGLLQWFQYRRKP